MRQLSLRGIPLTVWDGEALSNSIVRNNDFWESDILDYLQRNFKDQKTIIDVGANIGNHSVYFANFLNYEEILAFEPDCDNYHVLEENLIGYHDIKLAHMAASNRTGKAKLALNRDNYGAHEINDEGGEEIDCITLDKMQMFFKEPVTLLKIDAEWHEPQVLEGAEEIIFKYHPLILIEDTESKYGPLLEEKGYSLYEAWPQHGTYLWKWKDG